MPITPNGPAPYAPPGTVIAVVEHNRRVGLPTPVTTEVIARITGTPGLAPRVLKALRLYDLVDDNGQLTRQFDELARAPGEDDLKERFAEVLRQRTATSLNTCRIQTPPRRSAWKACSGGISRAGSSPAWWDCSEVFASTPASWTHTSRHSEASSDGPRESRRRSRSGAATPDGHRIRVDTHRTHGSTSATPRHDASGCGGSAPILCDPAGAVARARFPLAAPRPRGVDNVRRVGVQSALPAWPRRRFGAEPRTEVRAMR